MFDPGRFAVPSSLRLLLLVAGLGHLLALPLSGVCANEYVWDGTLGNWSQESKWLLGGQNNLGVPGAGDCAFIGSGTVNLDLSVSLETLELAGGQLAGASDVVVVHFEWTGGLLAGSDLQTEFLTTSGSCFISGVGVKQIAGRTLECGGLSQVVGGGDIIIGAFSSPAEIRLPVDATMSLEGDQAFRGQGGSVTGKFVNQGAFVRPQPVAAQRGLPGTTLFAAMLLDNAGTVRVEEGRLELAGGTSTGAFEAEIEGELVITFTSGTHRLLDGFSFSGAGFAGQSGGVVDVDAVGQASSWRQLGGTLQGDATFTIGEFEWLGGTLQGPGNKIATSGLALLGDGTKTGAGTFVIENQGNAIWQGAGTVVLDQTTLRNTAAASFEIQNDAILSRGAGQGFLDNQGLLRKVAGSGTTSLQLDVQNAGTFEIVSGDIELKAPGTGKYQQNAGTTLVPSGHHLKASSLLLSSGIIEIDGTLAGISGPMSLATLSGGKLEGDGSVSASTFVTSGDGTIAGNLELVGNVISGGSLAPGNSPGRLDVDGNITLSAGSTLVAELAGLAAGSGYDQVSATGTTSLGGSLVVLLGGGFLPQIGDSFQIVDANTTGVFAFLDLPPDFTWSIGNDPVVLTVIGTSLIFSDGFEQGTTNAWSLVVGAP